MTPSSPIIEPLKRVESHGDTEVLHEVDGSIGPTNSVRALNGWYADLVVVLRVLVGLSRLRMLRGEPSGLALAYRLSLFHVAHGCFQIPSIRLGERTWHAIAMASLLFRHFEHRHSGHLA
jgi:hypothetical protein